MNNELQRTLGTAARAARKRLGLTQRQAAERIGINDEFYARIERSVALPSVPMLARMVSVLHVRADALLGIDIAHAPTPMPRCRPGDSPEFRALVTRIVQAGPRIVHLVHKLMPTLEQAVRESASRKQP